MVFFAVSELFPNPLLFFRRLFVNIRGCLLNVRDLHRILDVILPLFVKFSIKMVLNISKAIFKILVDFMNDVIEKIVAELLKKM